MIVALYSHLQAPSDLCDYASSHLDDESHRWQDFGSGLDAPTRDSNSCYVSCAYSCFKRYREGLKGSIVVTILYVLRLSPEWIGYSIALARLREPQGDNQQSPALAALCGEADCNPARSCGNTGERKLRASNVDTVTPQVSPATAVKKPKLPKLKGQGTPRRGALVRTASRPQLRVSHDAASAAHYPP